MLTCSNAFALNSCTHFTPYEIKTKQKSWVKHNLVNTSRNKTSIKHNLLLFYLFSNGDSFNNLAILLEPIFNVIVFSLMIFFQFFCRYQLVIMSSRCTNMQFYGCPRMYFLSMFVECETLSASQTIAFTSQATEDDTTITVLDYFIS